MTAQIRIRDASNTLRTIDGSGSTRIRMRDAGGTLRTITRIRRRDQDGVLRTVYDTSGGTAFAATASPAVVNGFTAGSGSATTTATTIMASGGTGPYTYSWALTAHDNSVVPTANSPSAATSTFTQTNIDEDAYYTATFRCTVRDSAAHVTTVDVTATFEDRTSGDYHCVTADTQILMADGSNKPAGELKPGDMLRTRHETTLEWGDYPVLAIILADEPVFSATIDGNELRATAEHRVHVGGKWVTMRELGAPDGHETVAKITTGAGTYISNGILSHNLKILS